MSEKRTYSVVESDGIARVIDGEGTSIVEASTKDEAVETLKSFAGPEVEIKDSEPVVETPEGGEAEETPEIAEEPKEDEVKEEKPKTVPQKALHQARKKSQAQADLLTQVQESLTAINNRLAALETRPLVREEPKKEPDPFEGLPDEEFVSVKDIRQVFTARETKQKEEALDIRLDLFATMPKAEGDELTPAQAVGIVRKAFETKPELKAQLAAAPDPIGLVRQTAIQFAALMKMYQSQGGSPDQEPTEEPVKKATEVRTKAALAAKKAVPSSLGKPGESGEFTDEISGLIAKVQSLAPGTPELAEFLSTLPKEKRRQLMQRLEPEE